MSKKLAAKNALIEIPLSTKPVLAKTENPPTQVRTRTAVGGMAQFVTTQSPIHKEAEELREVVKSFAGAKLVRALDPALITPSQWANRHTDNFETEEFAVLKQEIKEAGGNVQPIKVRPLNRSTGQSEQGRAYEIIYGHRRHRACLELHIPVNALIEEVDDQTLFVQMERENRGRKNLSAWEQGCMYQSALDKGLYSSLRKLSEAIGIDVSLISKSVALARLPSALIDAFPSPLDIQYRWAQPLGEVLQKDPDGVIAEAKKIKAASKTAPMSALEVFTRLTERIPQENRIEQQSPVTLDGKRVGALTLEKRGGVSLKLDSNVLSADRHAAFVTMVEEFLRTK